MIKLDLVAEICVYLRWWCCRCIYSRQVSTVGLCTVYHASQVGGRPTVRQSDHAVVWLRFGQAESAARHLYLSQVRAVWIPPISWLHGLFL